MCERMPWNISMWDPFITNFAIPMVPEGFTDSAIGSPFVDNSRVFTRRNMLTDDR